MKHDRLTDGQNNVELDAHMSSSMKIPAVYLPQQPRKSHFLLSVTDRQTDLQTDKVNYIIDSLLKYTKEHNIF